MSNPSRSRVSQVLQAGFGRLTRARSDALHPWRYVTGALGGGPVVGQAKRLVSRLLYEYLARAYPQSEWTTMNYGYAGQPTEQHSPSVELAEPERFALQLYWYVATLGSQGGTLAGLDVLEVGSGRGGGAAFIARSLGPKTIVALDFSSAATVLARRRHQQDGSPEYVQGDAEHLFFAAGSFDVVLNVESAHCYGSIPRFLAEVHRVLRPGGELLLADFVSKRNGALERLYGALAGGPLRLVKVNDITPHVVRALELDEARKRELLERWVTGPFKTFARGAYAMEGTAMRRELESGQTVYLAAVLRRDDASRVD
jgi:ubiquinone/menaquinone biosynthesis C-methylase UbiE